MPVTAGADAESCTVGNIVYEAIDLCGPVNPLSFALKSLVGRYDVYVAIMLTEDGELVLGLGWASKLVVKVLPVATLDTDDMTSASGSIEGSIVSK